MQKLIKSLLFSILVICVNLQVSVAQDAKQFIEKDPAQYGKPFTKVPDTRDVTIYQVNMRAFSKEGNFKGVLERLDAIKALGINVVYLMPIYPVGMVKAVNSPYCVRDYIGVNSEFGTLEDLRAVVDGAHRRNIAIILDWVPNHTSFDNPWTSNKSWYLQDSAGNIISPPGTGWNDVAQLNFKNADMRLAMIKAMKYWVYTANIDGFRCDYTDGPPLDFWKQAIDTLRNISTHKLLLMAEGSRNTNYSVGFDYNFGFSFFGNLKRIYSANRTVLSIDSLNVRDYTGTSEVQQMIRYTTNHDVNGSDGTPLELFGGEKGSMAAFVVIAYMKSVPMIYNGQEVGTPYRLTFPFTSKDIDWTINPGITAEYKKIIAFRNNSKAIRRGVLTSYSTPDVCAFTKKLGNEEVLVISNLRDKSIDFKCPEALVNSSWKNAFDNKSAVLNGELSLTPFSYVVLKRK